MNKAAGLCAKSGVCWITEEIILVHVTFLERTSAFTAVSRTF